MLNLYSPNLEQDPKKKILSREEMLSVRYHDIFDYPLNFSDLIKWSTKKGGFEFGDKNQISSKRGYYYLKGREGLIYKRVLRERISIKKLEIAKKAARILSIIPNIKMVAATGSLAMRNCVEESDVDLMIITKSNTLWTTRLLSYFVLCTMHYALRRPKDGHQKDKLCLNIWMDESNLLWKKKDRSIYTAHEIAQVVPLVDKNNTYDKFLQINKWILGYWPNSVKIQNSKRKIHGQGQQSNLNSKRKIIERIAFKVQYRYMKSKITREVVTPTRAIFHPQDWGKVVLGRLSP